jgi:hypothetical protein
MSILEALANRNSVAVAPSTKQYNVSGYTDVLMSVPQAKLINNLVFRLFGVSTKMSEAKDPISRRDAHQLINQLKGKDVVKQRSALAELEAEYGVPMKVYENGLKKSEVFAEVVQEDEPKRQRPEKANRKVRYIRLEDGSIHNEQSYWLNYRKDCKAVGISNPLLKADYIADLWEDGTIVEDFMAYSKDEVLAELEPKKKAPLKPVVKAKAKDGGRPQVTKVTQAKPKAKAKPNNSELKEVFNKVLDSQIEQLGLMKELVSKIS